MQLFFRDDRLTLCRHRSLVALCRTATGAGARPGRPADMHGVVAELQALHEVATAPTL